MQLPVVTMNLKYDDNIENKSNSISFSMNAEQFGVLLAGKIFVFNKKKNFIYEFRFTSCKRFN